MCINVKPLERFQKYGKFLKITYKGPIYKPSIEYQPLLGLLVSNVDITHKNNICISKSTRREHKVVVNFIAFRKLLKALQRILHLKQSLIRNMFK